jgi:fibronectin type III domain protein
VNTYTKIIFLPGVIRTVSDYIVNVVINRTRRLQRLGIGLVVVLAGFFACTMAKAVSSVALEWIPNTDPTVTGYYVYYGGDSGDYTNVIDAGFRPSAEVDGLVEGQTYYFAVTAHNDFGDESDYSAETQYIVPGYLTLTPGVNPGDPLQLRFPVSPAHLYEVQVSEDLQKWITAWQIVGISNTWVEFDVPVGDIPSQFFRVVSSLAIIP